MTTVLSSALRTHYQTKSMDLWTCLNGDKDVDVLVEVVLEVVAVVVVIMFIVDYYERKLRQNSH